MISRYVETHPRALRMDQVGAIWRAQIPQDTRSFWRRLLSSLHPRLRLKKSPAPQHPSIGIEVRGGTDF